MLIRGIAIAAGCLLAALPASAQSLQWKETLSVPKGQNLPAGAKVDVLGVEVGSSYADAKASLQRLLAEAPPPPKPTLTPQQQMQERMTARSLNMRSSEPFEEIETRISLPVSSGAPIVASYVGQMILRRQLPGSTNAKIAEEITVVLSAPASGHQVFNIHREIRYPIQADQPLISDVVAALTQKLGGPPSIESKTNDRSTYKFVFAGGKLGPAAEYARINCNAGETQSTNNSGFVQGMNAKRQCDVVFELTAIHGISGNHASNLTFTLGDIQRAKESATADYKFFESYVSTMQQRGGTGPKL